MGSKAATKTQRRPVLIQTIGSRRSSSWQTRVLMKPRCAHLCVWCQQVSRSRGLSSLVQLLMVSRVVVLLQRVTKKLTVMCASSAHRLQDNISAKQDEVDALQAKLDKAHEHGYESGDEIDPRRVQADLERALAKIAELEDEVERLKARIAELEVPTPFSPLWRGPAYQPRQCFSLISSPSIVTLAASHELSQCPSVERLGSDQTARSRECGSCGEKCRPHEKAGRVP